MLDHRVDAAFMSLGELSAALGVSEVTILNFCRAISVDSFVELKKAFREEIKAYLNVPEKMKQSLREVESAEDAYANAVQTQRFNFERLTIDNPVSDFVHASELLAHSRKAYLCGLGVSSLVCSFLNDRLRTLGIDAVTLDISDIGLASHDIAKATSEDVFILVSFPDYSDETVRMADYLNVRGFSFIAITNTVKSPIAQGAEVVLISENRSLVFYNFISSTITLSEMLLIVLSYVIKASFGAQIEEMEKIQTFFLEPRNEKG